MDQLHFEKTDKKAFSFLPVILGVTVFTIIIGEFVLYAEYSTKRNIVAQKQSIQAVNLVHTCLEEGLFQIKQNSLFSGANQLVFTEGTCDYNVQIGAGDLRTINATGTVSQIIIRKGRAQLHATNPLTVTSWQEVEN